jgi:MFS transporter, DHA1 family, multidrug resistance protein
VTAEPAPVVVPLPRAVNWRRNLAALWLAEFTAIFGFSFAFPFLPLFLHKDLGIRSGPELAFWTGIAASATGFALAITSPIWGVLADRYGRKPMLVRAMIGGGVSVGLIGLVRTALQLTTLRVVQGATSGTVAAATALVAAETPPAEIGWALGILSSAIALGGAIGPAAGGVAANVVGLRAAFIGGGLLLLVAAVPVIFLVRESTVRAARRSAPRPLAVLRAAGSGTLRALGLLIIAQVLLQTSYTATQQLVVLRLLQFDPGAASAITGAAFAAGGIATAVAGVTYSRLLRWTGYRLLAAIAAALMAGSIAAAAAGPAFPLVVAAFVLSSLLFGALTPAFGAMIGLQTPGEVQASVFGLSSSATALGFGIGPLSGGIIASTAGVRPALGAAAVVALLLAGLIAVAIREPRPLPERRSQPAD